MTSRVRLGVCVLAAAFLGICGTVAGHAQTLPSGPITFADGQVTVGGDVSVAFAPHDPGFFNYTDYEHSILRLFRGDLTASVKAGDRITLLTDLRSENAGSIRPYALYVRLRPWTTRAIDIQAGRIPSTFGAFARRGYGPDNPLIGYPIAYQYLTSLREDSLPADTDELLQMRGHGSRLSFSIGDTELEHGVAIASATSWDTGVQVHASSDIVDGTASLTAGTLSYPTLRDNTEGKRLAGRVTVRPIVGLVIGASGSRGPFVTRAAVRGALGEGHDNEFTQTAWGGDVEYSRDYYVIRAETVLSEWTIPIVAAPTIDMPLRAIATSIEGRYKIRPGLYAAARFDHLGFSEVIGTMKRDTWDAPVTRVEIGGGYSLQRNLLLRLSYQYNARDDAPGTTVGLLAGQLQFWF